MSIEQIAAEALRLSEKDRAGLAARLLQSLPPVAVDDDEGVADEAEGGFLAADDA